LSYQKILEKHSIRAMIGYTSEHNKYDYLTGSKVNVPSNNEEMRTLDAALSDPETTGSYDVVNMISMFARLHYGYDNRYLVTASVRRDGTSKFGPDEKWGVFPSAALSWNISNEPFLDGIKRDILRVLKIRASWGQIGNTSMAPNYSNAYVSQVASDYRLRALVDNQPNNSYYFETIGNPVLSWETTEQINFGLDLGMFKNALFLTADYFIKNTEDMLMVSTVPGYSGYPAFSQPVVNAGSVDNRGFELELIYKGTSGKFSYDLSANFTSYKNEVTALHGERSYIQYDSPNRTAVGHPIGMFYGFETDGIFQTEEEVLAYVDTSGNVIQPEAVPGDIRFKDLNGDGEISNDGDRTFIGSPHPDFMYGFTINLRYSGFDLMTFWQGVHGNDIWNLCRDYDFDYGIKNTYKHIYDDAWRGEGTSDNQPRITTYSENNNFQDSDYFLEDGSYLRMKNLQLGYTLPERISQKLHISTCRIWIGGTDLLTFTSYTGIDPEIGLVHPQYSGLGDADTYPKYRKFMVGINVEF
jgi:TonB-linked SusC/RagA family outer membrane protein